MARQLALLLHPVNWRSTFTPSLFCVALVAQNHWLWVLSIATLLEGTHSAVQGAALNPPPLPILLPMDVLTPCQTGYAKKLLPLTRPWGLLQVLCRVSPDLPEVDHLPCKHLLPSAVPAWQEPKIKWADLNFLLILHRPLGKLQTVTSEGGPTLGAGEGEGCKSSSVHKATDDGSSCKEAASPIFLWASITKMQKTC